MKQAHAIATTRPLKRRTTRAVGLCLLVLVGFFLANLLVSLVISLLFQVGLLHVGVDNSIFMSVVAALVYISTLLLVIGVPYKLYGVQTKKAELGLSGWPSWTDMLLAPAGFVLYMILAGVLLSAISGLIPGFNADETQDVGFENLGYYYEYILAFLTLVVVAPIAEEVLMRGYLYGKLRKDMSSVSAILLSALLFALLHLGFGTSEQGGFAITQWNVALNILPLGIILATLRETTGSVWAGVLLHMLKNGVAFYLLFINPLFLHTIGG
jgi:membrane protease YdiL (CAAX protease family)